jgi:hypothetical protein
MLGIATSVFWIILIAFIASAGYSIKDINFGVGDPQYGTDMDGDLSLSLPLYIDNKGYYDLEEFTITTVLFDAEDAEVARASTFVPILPRGQNTSVLHNVTLRMDDLAQNNGQLLFSDSSLNVAFTSGLNFAELLPVQLSTNFTLPWGAPFADLALGEPRHNSVSLSNTGFAVPVSFENHAAFDLSGRMLAKLYDQAGTEVCESQSSLYVSRFSDYAGDLFFVVPSTLLHQSSTTGGHVEIHFFTSMFEYGPLVIPID